MNIVGQQKIKDVINNMNSVDELPKSLIISGDFGMGRHTIYDFICSKFDIQHESIDYELSMDILNAMYDLSIPTLYLVDFDKLSENKRVERFQNTLLKFIEEPPRFAWIIIIIHSSFDVLETIRNRCRIFRLQAYSLSELRELNLLYDKHFSDDDLLLLKTPYNIINTTAKTLAELKALSENIRCNIHRATVSNALSIRTKFEHDLDINLFTNVFIDSLSRCDELLTEPRYFDAILLTKELQHSLYVLGVNKNNLIDNYLLKLKLLWQ